MKAAIFHGTGNDSTGNWFPWLKEELQIRGYDVVVPDFPTPENQTLTNWLKVFDEKQLTEDTVLIGHSTGAVFALNLLERTETKISGAFLVAGFIGSLGLEDYDPLNETFAERDFDFDAIKENAGEIHLFHSEDDTYVPIEKAEFLENKLDAKLHRFENAGHLNIETGYEEFPEMLEAIP